MRTLFSLFVTLLLLTTQAFAEEYDDTEWRASSVIDKELYSAVEYLETSVNEDEWKYIKFFTVYDAPEALQQPLVLQLSFWVHSLTGVTDDGSGNNGYFAPLAKMVPTAMPPLGQENENVEIKLNIENIFVPFKLVAGSQTLYWIDIRDYNWTEEVFEKISVQEPYVRKPWIQSTYYDRLRRMSGNALIRASWFLMHTSDTSRQDDRGQEPLYYELLYANQKIPETADQYREIWGINEANAVKRQLMDVSIVDKGDSIVSRHARELSGIRTELGYHWESSDFKIMDNGSDVLENLDIERNDNGIPRRPAINRKADAHEFITSNALGLQVYFLTNGEEARVEFADPTIVYDSRQQNGDVRVKTARSCIVCHAIGINPTKHELRERLGRVDLISTFQDYQQAVKNVYLSNIEVRETDDQLIYARAVAQCNGLAPSENGRLYQVVTDWYDLDITLEQAARDCGVTIEVFKERVGASTSIRLVDLTNGVPLPRETWENPKGGAFAQAMLLIHRLPGLPEELQELPLKKYVVIRNDNCRFQNGTTVFGVLNKGDEYELLKQVEYTNGLWYLIKVGEQLGYVYNDDAELQDR